MNRDRDLDESHSKNSNEDIRSKLRTTMLCMYRYGDNTDMKRTQLLEHLYGEVLGHHVGCTLDLVARLGISQI